MRVTVAWHVSLIGSAKPEAALRHGIPSLSQDACLSSKSEV